MKKIGLFLALAALVCSAAPPPKHPKVSKDLETTDPQSTVKVIVQWNNGPDDAKEQKVVNRGGTVNLKLNSIGASLVTTSAWAAKELATIRT